MNAVEWNSVVGRYSHRRTDSLLSWEHCERPEQDVIRSLTIEEAIASLVLLRLAGRFAYSALSLRHDNL